MPQYLITSPEGKKFRITAPDGASKEQALEYAKSKFAAPAEPATPLSAQRYAAEDAATRQANEAAPWYEQLGTGLKTQAGRTMLGIGELANNLTGDRLIDPEVLAEAQRGADRMDAGTGVAGTVGNLAGDFRNYLPVGKAVQGAAKAKTLGQAVKQSAKIGALGGAVTGLTEATGDADSTVGTNLGNAAIGTGLGAGIGAALPVVGTAAKKAGNVAMGGINRGLAAAGSEAAAERVAYGNIGKVLLDQGYQPGEVASIIDEFKSQGIDGGTLGQIMESSGLLAREKNLLQGGGEAGRIMSERLKAQPKQIADSILAKVNEYASPEQTAYLYKQAAELADTAPGQLSSGNVTTMGQSASAKELPFTLKAIEDDIAARAEELPPTVLKRIQRIVSTAKSRGGFEAADTAKKQLDDLYKANSATTDQDIVNEVVLGYRKMLNDSLEQAGGETYSLAKQSAKRDMAMGDVTDAVKGAQGASVKTALNKFFGSIEQQEEFLRKLPDDKARSDFMAYLDNLQKVSGRFGGSDTASNTVTGKQMNVETGFGFDANPLNPQSIVDRLAAPISRNVRKAQAGVTFNPDAERLTNVMRAGEFNYAAPPALPQVLGMGAAKGAVPAGQDDPLPPAQPVPPPNAAPGIAPDIEAAEGRRAKSYTDTTGNKTIGIGFNMDSQNARKVWDQAGVQTPFDAAYAGKTQLKPEEINRLALASQLIAETDAKRLVPGLDELEPNRRAAVVQMAYQLGGPRMSEFDNTLKLINNGNFEAAASELKKSKYAKQTPGRVEQIARMLAFNAPYNNN